MATKVKKQKTDEANDETEKLISKLEKQIKAEYETAYKQMQQKYDAFTAAYAKKEKKKNDELSAGKITPEEMTAWYQGQVFANKKFEAMINTLADDGVISGTSANTYSPHLSIRRADFVMLLVKLYKLDTEITETFEDVTEDKYYYSDVCRTYGFNTNSFKYYFFY